MTAKIVIIGASGHGAAFCIPHERKNDRDFAAVAPGSTGESVEGLVHTLASAGYHPKVYADYREMLRKGRPDVAVVDNYYGEHAAVAIEAFRAGCHVFSEKPVACDLASLDDVERAYRQAGTHFASMLNYRYDPAFYRAYQLIAEGKIGSVRLLNAQKSYKFGSRPDFMTHRETYGGTIPWVGIHGVDWILWMSQGSFRSVTAVQSALDAPNRNCPETSALAQFQMSDEMMASLSIDYLNPKCAPSHGDDRIRVVGTKGTLEVRDQGVILINEDGVQHPATEAQNDLFTDFLSQIANRGICRVSAADSFAATRGVLCAQIAADSSKRVFFDATETENQVTP